ncbi:hypothetical protein ACFLZ4_00050 [Patescibacteria group bacterium]
MNLTSVAAFFKKGIRYLILIVGVYYLVTLIIFPGTRSIIRALFVPKEQLNPIYSQLPPLEFAEKATVGNVSPEYVLNTQNGKLPNTLPDRIRVYKFKPQQYSYLAGKNALTEAEALGFTEEDLITDLKGDVFKWRNSKLGSLLSIEVDSRRIVLETTTNNKSLYYTPGEINQQNAKEFAIELFQTIDRFDDELYQNGEQKVILGSFSSNRLSETIDIREAQVALVDFYRSLDGIPILGPDPKKGLLRTIIRKPSKGNLTPINNPMVEAYYWEIEPKTTAVYKIISVKDAWNAIIQNRGVITNVTPKNMNPFGEYTPVHVQKILVDNIFLAYYETPKYQTYLQPVYVFEGTYTTLGSSGGQVSIYFPAITGEYTQRVNQP